MAKCLALEKTVAALQDEMNAGGDEYEKLKSEYKDKKDELELKIVGLVDICNQHEKNILDLKFECSAKLETWQNENNLILANLNEEHERKLQSLYLESKTRLDTLRDDKDKEITSNLIK